MNRNLSHGKLSTLTELTISCMLILQVCLKSVYSDPLFFLKKKGGSDAGEKSHESDESMFHLTNHMHQS